MIFWPIGDALVGNNVFESDERQAVDNISTVDELVDVEVAVSPALAQRNKPIVDRDDVDAVFIQVHGVTPCLRAAPRRAPAENIDIIDLVDDFADQQRTAAEHGEFTGR